jgi:hypothetical protein
MAKEIFLKSFAIFAILVLHKFVAAIEIVEFLTKLKKGLYEIVDFLNKLKKKERTPD